MPDVGPSGLCPSEITPPPSAETFKDDVQPAFPIARGSTSKPASTGSSESSLTLETENDAGANGNFIAGTVQHSDCVAKENGNHGVALRGLAEQTTLRDVASVIRGGLILNMWLRPVYRSAHVVFVDSQAAQKFCAYARKNDIYLLGKRIEVSLDQNPYYIATHVAHRIAQGATRNLCIVNAKADITESTIRRDLEHIYRLEVVEVVAHSGDVYISLNAVHHALTAKNCLASQLRYKGTKIEFYDDECAQDLPKPTFNRVPTGPLIPPKKNNSMSNRFEMLFGDDSGSSDEEPEQMRAYVSREQGLGWAGNAIMVSVTLTLALDLRLTSTRLNNFIGG